MNFTRRSRRKISSPLVISLILHLLILLAGGYIVILEKREDINTLAAVDMLKLNPSPKVRKRNPINTRKVKYKSVSSVKSAGKRTSTNTNSEVKTYAQIASGETEIGMASGRNGSSQTRFVDFLRDNFIRNSAKKIILRKTTYSPQTTEDEVVLQAQSDVSLEGMSDLRSLAINITFPSTIISPSKKRARIGTRKPEFSSSKTEDLMKARQESVTFVETLSGAEMSASADSDLAKALKRVTGLSVVGGKYVYIRGLGERYSRAMLNNATLPSTEPDKRIIPFDIFPSDIMSSVVVVKTYTPDMPSDFAGGFIKMHTKEFPDKPTFKISLSNSSNSQTTFKDIEIYEGGKLDFIGIDDGTRAIPEIVRQASKQEKIAPSGRFGGGFAPEELENFGESFLNIWQPTTKRVPINQGYSFSLGNQTEFWGRPFGYVASLTYKNGYSLHNEKRNYYILGANRSLEARHEIDNYKISNFNVLWGGIVNASYMPATDQKVSISTTYTRSLDDEVRSYSEFPNRDHNLDEKGTRLRWIERSLFSTQVSGEKHFFSTELDWRATYSLATRNEPDTRETLYESNIGENNFKLADESQSGSRFFSHLIDNNLDAGLDWRVPFYQFVSLPGEFRFGASFVYRDREVDSRRFRFKPQDFHQVNIYQEAEKIFTPENIGPKGFQLMEDTRATDNYKGEQTLGAGYALMDFLLTSKLRMAMGTRLEVSNQKVTTFELFNPNNVPVVGEIKTTDVLPAINITYKMRENMNMRSAVSQTLSRPSFRELSEFEFTDIAGHAVIGNPELERAFIQNYDFRWEWYPRIRELLAISLFYKDFERPIEKIILPATEPASSWQNAESAFNYGTELEIRKNLGFINSFLADFSLSTNLALIKSQVKLGEGIGIETSKKRPLQGQSPYILNLMASYDNPRLGATATLLYNIFGKRISEAGIAGTPDIYEQPFAQLDFVFEQSLAKLNLKLTCKNLLDPEVKFKQGDKTQRAYKKGRSFGLGASYNF